MCYYYSYYYYHYDYHYDYHHDYEGLIRHLAGCNVDTEHLAELVEAETIN